MAVVVASQPKMRKKNKHRDGKQKC